MRSYDFFLWFDHVPWCVCARVQYEQLTQMKSAFQTKMQRQHELSEVNYRLISSLNTLSDQKKKSERLSLFTSLSPAPRSELQPERSAGKVKGRGPSGRGGVRGDGRELPGRKDGDRRLSHQLHGEKDGTVRELVIMYYSWFNWFSG